MTSKLVQKSLTRGTREFEIVDDAVKVRIKAPFAKEETLTVMLAVLNPEPVISKSLLSFTSRVNNEPLLSLYLARPNPEEFNAFVNLLKQKAQQEFRAFAGLKPGMFSGLEGNVYEEPQEMGEPRSQRKTRSRHIKAESVENAVKMLAEYVGGEEIGPFLAALEALQSDPMNEALLSRLVDEFDALGPRQGAVLTYAPYVGILMSDNFPAVPTDRPM